VVDDADDVAPLRDDDVPSVGRGGGSQVKIPPSAIFD